MSERIKVFSNGQLRFFTKLELVSDAIKKIVTLHDCDIMPGTESYGADPDKFPAINNSQKVPPWGAKPDGSVLSTEEFESMPIGMLKRFNVRIEGQMLNIGIVKINGESPDVVHSLLNYPFNSYKDILFSSLSKLNSDPINATKDKDYLTATQYALYEFFFGPRSKQVLKRYMFYIGDGLSAKGKDAIDLCNSLAPENLLATRRPLDVDLWDKGVINEATYKLKQELGGEIDNKAAGHLWKPLRYNGGDKLNWYQQPMPTTVFFGALGSKKKGISTKARRYAFDYSKRPMNPIGYFDFMEGSNEDQFNRILGIVNIVDRLAYDNGFQNLFSITLHNCGPHDVTLLNTVVNFENDIDSTPEEERTKPYMGCTKYTTQYLKSGIPTNNDLHNIITLNPGGDEFGYGFVMAGEEGGSNLLHDTDPVDNIEWVFEATHKDDPSNIIEGRNPNFKLGMGGQFYGDPENRDLLEDVNSNYNILWHSFNTKYEVYRRGQIKTIDGGWSRNWQNSNGVKNDGVAFKGMPIRVFKSESTGFEIIDYNIGNVSSANGYMGDYSHLPVLKSGEEIDLFFGIRTGETLDISKDLSGFNKLVEKVQLFFNSEDKTLNKMACFANVDFNIACPLFNPSKKINPEGYDLVLPFTKGKIAADVKPADDGKVDNPMAGVWEVAFDDPSYIHDSVKFKFTIPERVEPLTGFEGEIYEGLYRQKVRVEMNFDTKELDLSDYYSNISNGQTYTDENKTVTFAISNASRQARDGYTPPTGALDKTIKKYANANALYDLDNKAFYLELTELTSASSSPIKLRIPKNNGSMQTLVYNYSGAASGKSGFPDTSVSPFKFHFEIDPETQSESSGMGVDAVKVLKSGGQGNYLQNHYYEFYRWNHSVDGGYADPWQVVRSTAWKNTPGKSAKIRLLS